MKPSCIYPKILSKKRLIWIYSDNISGGNDYQEVFYMSLRNHTKKEETALEATIKAIIIKMSRYYGASDNETAVNLIKELDITEEEAEELICNYDKEMDEALENAIRSRTCK